MDSTSSTLAADEDRADRRETRRLVLAWLISLVIVFGGALLWIAAVRPTNAARIFPIIFGLATLPGKYLIFAGLSKEVPLGPWQMAVLATFVDVATALTFAVGLGWAERVKWVQRTLKSVHDKAERVLDEFPRLKRMAFFGVVLFVFLPLPASGSIGGTFVGQFLGLSRSAVVMAVTVGGVLVSILFAALAKLVGAEAQRLLANPWLAGISVVVFALFIWLAWRRARRMLQHQ